jgi:hypothetical protein
MAAKNGALTLTSDDVNYLVYRYMQESGVCIMRSFACALDPAATMGRWTACCGHDRTCRPAA